MSSPFLSSLRRFIALVLLGVWWGGFTFYALAVVPSGHLVLGSKVRQGFITEQVTGKLNGLGVTALAAAASEIIARRRDRPWLRRTSAWWLGAVVTLGALFWLHHVLAGQMDFANRTLPDEERFYAWHRVYLLVATVQWLTGLALLWILSSHRGADLKTA